MIEIWISLILQNLAGWMLFNLHGNLVHTPPLGARDNASIDLRYSVNPLKYRCHGFLRGGGSNFTPRILNFLGCKVGDLGDE